MIGGQVIDLESEKKPLDVDRIMQTHIRKTGALLAASAVIGTVLAGGDNEKIAAATEYAINLGIAFQIQDDILDVIGDSAVLGKPVGSDDRNEKSSYVAFAGLDKAKQDVILYTNKAVKALEIFGERKETLKELALYLVDRNY
jgi:geranylgeranyl diphosphate synthase type II